MTNKRVFLLECSAPVWIDVAKKCQENNIDIVGWAAWDRQIEIAQPFFPNCAFWPTQNCKIGNIDISNMGSPIFDESCIKIIEKEFITISEMITRFDHSSDMAYSQIFLFIRNQLTIWRRILLHFNPDLLVFPAPPHVVYDYILLALARELGIKTLMFEEATILPPFSLPMDDYLQGAELVKSHEEFNDNKYLEKIDEICDSLKYKNVSETSLREKNTRDEKQNISNDKTNYLLECINRIKSGLDIDIFQVKNGIKSNVNNGPVVKEAGKSIEDSFNDIFGNMKYNIQALEHSIHTLKREDIYNNLCVEPDFDIPYVYFPLAGQPERTSCPQAGIFSNQILVCDILRQYIPKTWKILVKEHPNQLNPNFYCNSNRAENYYYDLLKIPNVQLVKTDYDSSILIENTQFIVTTGGTTALEGVTRGKKSLIFGHAWYRDCEGIETIEGLKFIKNQIRKIIKSPAPPKDALNLFLRKVAANSINGWADFPNENIIFDVETTSKQIFEQICIRI